MYYRKDDLDYAYAYEQRSAVKTKQTNKNILPTDARVAESRGCLASWRIAISFETGLSTANHLSSLGYTHTRQTVSNNYLLDRNLRFAVALDDGPDAFLLLLLLPGGFLLHNQCHPFGRTRAKSDAS